jgi:hypothetical protein
MGFNFFYSYNNQGVNQFTLLLNDSLIAGEHNALLSGDITPLTFLPFPPFGTKEKMEKSDNSRDMMVI